jgi:preprotein translocase subunit SecB
MAEDQKTDPIMTTEDVADDQQSDAPETPQTAAPAMGAEDLSQAQFQIQKIYAKDASFEVPNSPGIFQEQGQADVKMSLSQRVESLGDDLHEVALTVTITATLDEKTAYLAEVSQCGVFLMKGFPEQAFHAVVNTMCPNTLFPYARAAISDLVTDGGFPAVTLQPVNFEQLYSARLQELAAQQGGGAGNNGAGQENPPTAEFSPES